MAGTIQAGTLISSNSRSINVDDIGVRSYAGGGGAFNYRNKIVDGRFDFWYEGTSQTSSGYGSDTAWRNENIGSTKVHSRGTLTPGVDLPCIEVPTARYFSRTVVSSVAGAGNRCRKYQAFEQIYTLAGKQVTVSFYAKSNAAQNMSVGIEQNPDIAGGGSPLVNIFVMKKTLSTSWTKYVATVTLPSIAGLTINQANFFVLSFWFDAGSDYNGSTSSLGQQSGTFDIACVQVEEGSVATPFEELPIEISQMRVNRYYQRLDYTTDLAVAYISTITATTHPLELRSIMCGPPTYSVVRNSGTVKCITAAGTYTTYTPSETVVTYGTNTHFLLQFTISAAAAYSAYVSQFNGYVIADARL